MNEYDRLFEGEFFIIDSLNLNQIESKLYGFSIKDGKIIENDNFDNEILDGTGAYVQIQVNENEIGISQDFIGSYGLYLYKSKDYFAISNSFIKLVDYLKNNNKNITFNKGYADSFLFAGLCTFLYEKTLVNEIEVIPRNNKIIISKLNKTLEFIKIDYEEHSINIDSKKGIEILDKWYEKWVSIIRQIKKSTNRLNVDLSGGFDTRVVSALWLSSNIDLNKVNIHSNEGKVHVMEEDYRIASQIAKKFNFNLNHRPYPLNITPFEELNTPLDISFNIKLGFHKELYFRYERHKNTLYSITGSGGETIRGYPNKNYKDYVEDIINSIKKYDETIGDVSEKELNSSLDRLKNKFKLNEDSLDELPEHSYNEIRCRNHYGKSVVESYFYNTITLTPLLDPDLHKLKLNTDSCEDKHLLIALIYIRYCPDLLNFEFEGNRAIDKNSIDVAYSINKMYPKSVQYLPFISGPEISNETPEKINWNQFIKFDEANDFLKDVFKTRSFELEFKKYYPNNIYDEINKFLDKSNFYPLKYVYSALSVLKIIHDTGFSIPADSPNSTEWLYSFKKYDVQEKENKYMDDLLKYMTARIDIKNKGTSSNTINIFKSNDYNLRIYHENWFKDEFGEGIILESTKGILDLEFECVGDGELNLTIKSKDVRDKHKNRFPVYIHYTNFKINGETISLHPSLISHDNPHIFKKKVRDSEKINVHLEWMPFNELSEYK